MPTYQGRLITCLMLSTLCATSWADTVLVNTTSDKTADDTECSIREAVNYLSQKNIKKAAIDADVAVINTSLNPLKNSLPKKQLELVQEQSKDLSKQDPVLIATLTKEIEDPITGLKKQIADKAAAITLKETELLNYRSKGINGCYSLSNEDTNTIKLQQSTSTYDVNSAITVNISVSFVPETSELPANIKAVSNNALFMIDDGIDNDAENNPKTAIKYISVSFNDISFLGCSSDFCATNGGIFYNKESLSIKNSTISGGRASLLGGAIYNAINALFSADQLLLQSNQANEGAAIYSEQSAIYISNSLITKNTATNTNAIVTIAKKDVFVVAGNAPSIINSTFSGNTGTAISARDTLSLKSLTIVLNTNGVNFNNESPILYNSIIAANTSQDCLNLVSIPSDTSTYMAHNVYQNGCDAATSSAAIIATNPQNTKLAITEKIIADTEIGGKNTGTQCAAPPAKGLLCPLSYNGGTTQTHKPRLLSEYKTLTESPIINKGSSETTSYTACSASDQRGLPRENCDIGAVEIQGLVTARQGRDITYGQKAIFDTVGILGVVGDGELLPANQCSTLYGNITGNYKDGCLMLINSPTKGIVEFDNTTHQVLYTATLADFHGFDKFTYGMTTTISRFSDAKNDQSVKVDVKVVSEPASGLSNKSLDTGATSIFSLLMLSLLMVWRRTR